MGKPDLWKVAAAVLLIGVAVFVARRRSDRAPQPPAGPAASPGTGPDPSVGPDPSARPDPNSRPDPNAGSR